LEILYIKVSSGNQPEKDKKKFRLIENQNDKTQKFKEKRLHQMQESRRKQR